MAEPRVWRVKQAGRVPFQPWRSAGGTFSVTNALQTKFEDEDDDEYEDDLLTALFTGVDPR